MIDTSMLAHLLDLTARLTLLLALVLPFLRLAPFRFGFFRFWRWRLPSLTEFRRIALVSVPLTVLGLLTLPFLDAWVYHFGASIGQPPFTPSHPQVVAAQAGFLWLLFLIMIPLVVVEEWFFRRNLLEAVKRRHSIAAALLVSSLAFALAHLLNPGTGWLGAITPFAAGLIFGVAYLLGGIQSSCAVHISYNVAVFLLWWGV